MTVEDFWLMIERSRSETTKEINQVSLVEKELVAIAPREMVAFEGHCWDLLSISLTRELWAVATIIQPTCTHAAFDGVRAWMVLQGKEFFDRVLAEPQRLADRAPRGRVAWVPDGEMLLRLVPRLYRAATGDDLPTVPRKVPYVLKGARWTEYDLPELYPDLWRKYRS